MALEPAWEQRLSHSPCVSFGLRHLACLSLPGPCHPFLRLRAQAGSAGKQHLERPAGGLCGGGVAGEPLWGVQGLKFLRASSCGQVGGREEGEVGLGSLYPPPNSLLWDQIGPPWTLVGSWPCQLPNCSQLTLLEGPGLLGAGRGHRWDKGQGDPRGAEISAEPPEPQPGTGLEAMGEPGCGAGEDGPHFAGRAGGSRCGNPPAGVGAPGSVGSLLGTGPFTGGNTEAREWGPWGPR